MKLKNVLKINTMFNKLKTITSSDELIDRKRSK